MPASLAFSAVSSLKFSPGLALKLKIWMLPDISAKSASRTVRKQYYSSMGKMIPWCQLSMLIFYMMLSMVKKKYYCSMALTMAPGLAQSSIAAFNSSNSAYQKAKNCLKTTRNSIRCSSFKA